MNIGQIIFIATILSPLTSPLRDYIALSILLFENSTVLLQLVVFAFFQAQPLSKCFFISLVILSHVRTQIIASLGDLTWFFYAV